MRLELETLHISLNEFVDHVIASDESVELTRGNEVVLTFEKVGVKKKSVWKARSPVESARQRIAVDLAAKKATVPRRVEKKIAADESVPLSRENARARIEQFLSEVRADSAKRYKSEREIVREVNSVVREVRKQNASRPR